MILHAVVEEFFIEDEIQFLLMQNHRMVTISCVLATLRRVHVLRSRAVNYEKLLSPPFPVGGGAVVTNDKFITTEIPQ